MRKGVTNSCVFNCESEVKRLLTEVANLKKLVYNAGPNNGCCVVSVNGKDGVVVLNTTDIAEGSNKYYTNSRVQVFSDPRYAFKVHTHILSQITDFPPPSGHTGEFLTTDGNTVFWQTIPSVAAPYTNEQAQDAVGGILTDSPSIDFVYDDSNNVITAHLKQEFIEGLELGQTPVHEIRFTVGQPNSPQSGDSSFILRDENGAAITNKRVRFFRERVRQISKGNRDWSYNASTGQVTVTNSFYVGPNGGEDCIFECYEPSSYIIHEYYNSSTGFPYTLPLTLS